MFLLVPYIYVIVAFVGGALAALLGMRHIKRLENLTKEEYSHCVQMVLNDFDIQKADVQGLLNELQEYANNETAVFEQLTGEAKAIISKVKAMKL